MTDLQLVSCRPGIPSREPHGLDELVTLELRMNPAGRFLERPSEIEEVPRVFRLLSRGSFAGQETQMSGLDFVCVVQNHRPLHTVL